MHSERKCLNFLFMGTKEELVRVNAERQANRWSWAEFGRRLGESPQTINNWRKRGIPGDKKFAVAQALGKSVEWLVTGTKVPMYEQGEPLVSGSNGLIGGKEPVYPPEPFNRFSRLAQLWPYLTD